MSKAITVEQFNRTILNAKDTGLKQFKDGYVSGLRYEIKKDHVTSVLKYKTHLGNYTSKQLRKDIRHDVSIDELSLLAFRQQALDFLKTYRENTQHQKITIIDLYRQHFDEYYQLQLKNCNTRAKKPSNIQTLNSLFSSHSRNKAYKLIIQTSIEQYNDDFQQSVFDQCKTSVSEETARRRINALRGFINFLVDKKVIQKMPFTKYKWTNTSKPRQNAIHHSLYKEVIEFLYEKNTQEADYLLLLFATGARKNELAELRVRDVKFLESDNSSRISLLLKKTKNSEARTARIFIQKAENAIKRTIEDKDLDDYVFYDADTLYGICNLKSICDELVIPPFITEVKSRGLSHFKQLLWRYSANC